MKIKIIKNKMLDVEIIFLIIKIFIFITIHSSKFYQFFCQKNKVIRVFTLYLLHYKIN